MDKQKEINTINYLKKKLSGKYWLYIKKIKQNDDKY